MIDVAATGKEISKRMYEKKLNISQLADQCIVSVQAIYKWTQGRCIPTTENLVELAKALDCKMDDLIKEKEE